jgi:hypothetical protein
MERKRIKKRVLVGRALRLLCVTSAKRLAVFLSLSRAGDLHPRRVEGYFVNININIIQRQRQY